MDLFRLALKTSYSELVKCIEMAKEYPNAEHRNEEVNYRLGTCLHWLLDYLERNVSSNTESLVSAFKFANNQLKHEKSLINLYDMTGGIEFSESSFEFPFSSEEFEFRGLNCQQPMKDSKSKK